MTEIRVSIVLPVFNEENNITLLYEKLLSLDDISNNNNVEIIFVNDGSTDNSAIELRNISEKDHRVKVIYFSRNFGHQAALTAGIKHSKGKAVITMDCDNQDPPEMIPELIEKWKQGAKVVYTRRNHRKDNFFKRTTARFYYKILKRFTDQKIYGDIGDFRLLDRAVVEELVKLEEKTRYLRGMVNWLGFEYEIIDYNRPKRAHGKTKFSLLKMIRLAMAGVLNFSLLPLRIGLVIGLITIFLGIFFLVYIFIDTVWFDQIYPLYKWLSVITFVFVGFLFVLIWILGEYIGKTYEETKNRPLYIIREKINIE